MRKLAFLNIIFTLTVFLAQHVTAQHTNHRCAEAKSKSFNLKQKTAAVYPQSLMGKYDVKHYWLNVNVERNTTYISGNVHITAEAVSSLDTFAFELHTNHTIDSVVINGSKLTYSRQSHITYVPVSIAAGNTITATIYYKGTAPTGAGAAIGDGFTTDVSPSWGNEVTWSLSQPFSAYEWFPCKQQLKDKADSSWVYITTDTANMAGSNGILKNVVDLGNGKKRFEWQSKYPIDYYLISVAVAKYIDYSIYAKPAALAGDSVLIQNFVYDNPACLPNFQTDIDDTRSFLELYSDLYGLYPFWKEKYGHCMAPLGGGMEHQTMTSQGFFEFTLTAHELGHQWFGDNVTCKTWQDIWVNEGFASYSEYLALQNIKTQADADQWMLDAHTSIMSSAGGSVFVPDTTNPNRIFSSRLTYEKGAAILHTLRFEMNNDSLFFKTLQDYQTTYKDGVAGATEFKQIAETTTGLDFTQYFDQWYYGEGYPLFSIRWNFRDNFVIIKSTQTTSMPSVTSLFKTPLEFKLVRAGADTTIRVYQENNIQYFKIPITTPITGVQLDPSNWIINKLNNTIRDTSMSVANYADMPAQQEGISAVYPNPASNGFYIVTPDNEPALITIFDNMGREIMHNKTDIKNNYIHTSEFAEGMYIIKVATDTCTEHHKLFVSK